jgi:hypothetical protein
MKDFLTGGGAVKTRVDYYSRYAYDFAFLFPKYSFLRQKPHFFRYFAKKVEKFL